MWNADLLVNHPAGATMTIAGIADATTERSTMGEVEFRRLLEKLPAGAYTCDADGLITYFNQQAVALWGRIPRLNHPSDRFCGSFKLFRPDGAPVRHDDCWMALALRNNREYDGREIVIERPDGKQLTALAYATPILGSSGELRGAVNVLVDISERKLVEEQARLHARQQLLLYQLTDTMNRAGRLTQIYDAALKCILESVAADRAAILLCDAEGVMRFVAWRGLSDSYRQAVEGHSPWALGTADPQPVCICDVEEATFDPAVRGAIRREQIGAVAFVPLTYMGRLLGKFMLYYDRPHDFGEAEVQLAQTIAAQVAFAIERKRSEQSVRRLLRSERSARAQAERASRAKDEFLAVLSHELRTPLTPVLLTAALMETDPELPPKFRADVAAIRQNVELESRLISDLLDLTRIAKGKMQLDLLEVDVHLLIRSAIDICQRENSAKLHIDLTAGRHHVSGDSARLQQVFWNLISNAQKFTPTDGQITIRTCDAPADRICIEVADTGEGIDPTVLPKLFTAFEQGDIGATRQFGGLGLGLAISRRLVELHGGSIRATSDGKNRGATFTVELPTVPAPEGRVQPRSDQPRGDRSRHGGRSLRILLVEDHEPTLNAMKQLLARMGHCPVPAASLRAARVALRQETFDLILSDIGLPDGSGLSLMQEFRGEYAGRAIALTGYGMEDDVQKSQDAGFATHLTKPVDLERIADAIGRVSALSCGGSPPNNRSEADC